MLFQSSYSSPLGDIIILTNETHVLGLWFQNQKHFAAHYDLPAQPSERPLLDQTKDWLTDYFDGHEPDPANLPLAPAGTAFQRSVFQVLQTIPYGQTVTYQQIVEQLNTPTHHTAARAVGGAVGRNPISIVIPCHRVVGSNGDLTGYAGGIDRKVWLLNHESTTLL